MRMTRFCLFCLLCFGFPTLAFSELNRSPHIIFLTTQKGGTHLLQKAIRLIIKSEDYESAGIWLGHLEPGRYDRIEKKALLIRDPRDIIIAQLYFLELYPWRENHPWIQNKDLYEYVNSLPFKERIAWVISHPEDYQGIYDSMKLSIELMKDPFVSVFRFEDLVGPQGGGDQKRQENALMELATLIGYHLSPVQIMDVINHVFGGTNSFRKGQIGSWKDHFSLQDKELFKKFLGRELIELGYVDNEDW